MSGQLGQAPIPAEHGSFLQTASVAGGKVDFVATTVSSTGQITLNAAGDASLFDFGYFDLSLSIAVNGNLKSWDDIVAWNYCACFIDNVASDVVQANQYRIGSSAISTRGKQSINIFQLPNPFQAALLAGGFSHETFYLIQNLDSSSHTVTGRSAWKFIITG